MVLIMIMIVFQCSLLIITLSMIMIFSIIHMHVHKNNTSIHCVVCISQLPCFEASVDVYRCVLSGIIILCIIYACL